MPQKNVVSDFEKSLGRTAESAPDVLADFETHRAASGKKVPMTPAEITATLPAGATPVGQRGMTPAETEMTKTAPPAPIGAHGEMAPGGEHPLAATINPVTKQPFPGQRRENTSAENWKLAREAAPWVAGAAAGALSEGTMTWPVRAATAAMLAGGTQAGVQFFDPERPDSAAARGIDIITKGAEVGGTEAAGELIKLGGGALMKRYFPEIADAIQQGTTKFLHAVPSNDIAVRTNYEIAQGDLQAIANEMLQSRSTLGIANPGSGVFSRKAPGGIVSAEMRPSELYAHIKDYMGRMYSDERKWQIMKAGGQQITVDPARAAKFDPEVFADAMRRIARIPDIEDGAHKIALRVAANPTAPITVEEADILEQAASTMLRKFRAGTGSKQAVDLGTQRNTALMQHADEMLNDSLNYALQQGGLPGINGYARRYAALARVMDGLERMIPATERGRLGLGPAEVVSPSKIVRTITTMAGQNPGREIEDAMRILSRAPDIPKPTGVPIPGLPGRPGPVVGPPGAAAIPHPPTPAGPAGPAGPPLNMGQPPTLGMGTPPALPPHVGMPAPPPFVLAGQAQAGQGMQQLTEMRNAAKAAGASDEILANMDRRIADLNKRVADLGPPAGQVERRAVSKGTVSVSDALAGKFKPNSMGTVEIDTGLSTKTGPVTITMMPGKITQEAIDAAIAKKRQQFGKEIITATAGMPKPPNLDEF